MKRHFICALTGLVFSLSLIFSSVTIAKPDTWTKKADMPTARGGLSASVVKGKIYAIGGLNIVGGNALSTEEEYDTGFADEGVEAKGKLATKWGEIKVYR